MTSKESATISRPRKATRRPSASLKTRLHQTLADTMGNEIVSGVYKPGDSLPGEIAASQNLQVSRNAYREAVRILAAKGLVESRQKAGTLVTPRSRWNLLDPDVLHWMLGNRNAPNFIDSLLELRLIVEPAAAAMAAERRSEEDLVLIEAALQEMREHEPDSPAGEKADEHFHAAVLNAGGNELLCRLANIILAGVEFVAEYKRERKVDRDTWPDHKLLFDAISAKDQVGAHGAMAGLIQHARSDLGFGEAKA
jgi:DNA-binding FadR family transcriptional regulator